MADLVPGEEAVDRTLADRQSLCRHQTCTDLLQSQIRLGRNKIEQPLLVGLERRAAVAGIGRGIDAAGIGPAIHPADRR